ncbi:hypothetical protein POTG_01511 [Paenibacillus sp. oral taxon 786 str. D14]|nr:hypothetical protein POTG_01511 [Paenibacillus sp. oral taxon 786 str. D14]
MLPVPNFILCLFSFEVNENKEILCCFSFVFVYSVKKLHSPHLPASSKPVAKRPFFSL